MRHISTLKQATKEAKTKTKQRTRRETCKKIELTKLCILALKVSARSVLVNLNLFYVLLLRRQAAVDKRAQRSAPRREERRREEQAEQRYAMMIAQRIKPVHK